MDKYGWNSLYTLNYAIQLCNLIDHDLLKVFWTKYELRYPEWSTKVKNDLQNIRIVMDKYGQNTLYNLARDLQLDEHIP